MLWLNSFIRRLKLKRRKPYAILPLIVILLFISIGYAYLNATLSINGTSMLDSARWDVHFENIQVKNGSVTPTVEPIISNNTTVSFSVTLENPGDYYGFIIDVVNAGTLDAMIESISILPTLTESQQKYFDYTVTYEDGASIANSQRLDANSKETLRIEFVYKELENTDLYPTEDDNITIAVSITYSQSTGNSIDIPHNNAYFLAGSEVNVKMKQLAGDTITSNETTVDENIIAIKESSVEPENTNKENKNIVSTNDSDYPIYMWYDNGIIYWWSVDKNPSLNDDASAMFSYMSNLEDLQGLEFWDFSTTQSIRNFFAFDYSVPNCQYLSKWDVTKVNNMSYMFKYCTSLNNASGIDNWNILSSANFTEMFKDSNVHPNFTRVVGTWDSDGTFTPS